MKKNTIKQVFAAIALLAFVSTLTSCNKGYGCPNNFKVVKNVVELVR